MTKQYLVDHPDYISHIIETPQLYPTAINIELTTYCNLKCIMCPKTAGLARTPPNQKIDFDLLEKILRDLIPSVSRIDLVGDGEIFLEPDRVKKVLEYAKRHHVLVNGSTNGILLNREIVNMIIEGKMHDLNISMDAAQAETYRVIRRADFNLLCKNIEQLNSAKFQTGSNLPHLHFSMVGMNRNIKELPDLVRLASKYNVESVTLQAMGEFEKVKNESIFLRNKELGKIWFEKAKKVGNELGILVNLWPEGQFDKIQDEDPFQSNDSNVTTSRRKDCDFAWDVPYFATDGTVRPCCAMPPLGQLNKSDFQSIWNGKGYQKLRKAIYSLNPPQICRNCPGRGWFSPVDVNSILRPGTNDRQFGLGWYHTESQRQDGSYRWARERASFFLAGENQSILSMTVESASEKNTTQTIKVMIDKTDTQSIDLREGKRSLHYFKLPNNHKKIHQIEISGTPWRPVDVISGSCDPRYLTVKFWSAQLLGEKCSIKFENDFELIGYEFEKVNKHTFNIDLYWKTPSFIHPKLKIFVHAYPFNGTVSLARLFFFNAMRLMGFQFPQSDINFPCEISASRVTKTTSTLKHPDLSTGKIQIFCGLYNENGQRIKITSNNRLKFRQSIYLNTIQLTSR